MEREREDLSGYLPRFSLAERDRRWAAVRALMGVNGLDCLLVLGNDRFFGYGNSNVRYLTQIDGQRMGAAAIFPYEGDPLVFAVPPHMHDTPFPVYRAFNNWIAETRALAGMKAVTDSMKQLGYGRGHIGLVGFRVGPTSAKAGIVSYEEYMSVLSELPEARVSDATAIVDAVRMIKSAEEIAMLKRSGEISAKKIEAMVRMARPGVRECELFAEMVRTEIALGAEAITFNLLASGPARGEKTQHLLHGRGQTLSPTTRTLAEGDIVMTEFHTSYGGYLTGCEKSVFIGKPPDELRRVHDVAAECMEAGIARLRPGVTVGEAADAFREPARRAGMEYIELGFHGHGLSSPEFPSCAYEPKGRDRKEAPAGGVRSVVIAENMVFATNIDIHDPAWRRDVGIMGPGETVWVTSEGPVRLVGASCEFTCV
jgi:Xaa-Pro aminopeptidase